jgi:hypothetical protein
MGAIYAQTAYGNVYSGGLAIVRYLLSVLKKKEKHKNLSAISRRVGNFQVEVS